MKSFDELLLDSGNIMRRGYSALAENTGKLIALIAALVAVLLTYADVQLPGVATEGLTAEIAVMIIAAYIIYFSLEEAGERLGMQSDVYIKANNGYKESLARVSGDDVYDMREFCIDYSKEELEYRKRATLLKHGLCQEDLERYKAGGKTNLRTASILSHIDRMKPIDISPSSLLGSTSVGSTGIRDPEKYKPLTLALKLIPSVLCMIFTVSMIITAKPGLDAAAIIGGIVKLSALPMIALRGYSQGYSYATEVMPVWLSTKKQLIDAFLSRQAARGADDNAPG